MAITLTRIEKSDINDKIVKIFCDFCDFVLMLINFLIP